MTAELVEELAPADEVARRSRQAALDSIDRQFSETRLQIIKDRTADFTAARERSLARTRAILPGVIVTIDGQLIGDPATVQTAVAALLVEIQRATDELAAVQGDAEAQWDAARQKRGLLRAPFDFGGATARRRLRILSPNTATEA